MNKRTAQPPQRKSNSKRGAELQKLALELLVISGQLRRNQLKSDLAAVEVEVRIDRLRNIWRSNAST